MRSHPLGREAAIVGECVEERPGFVVLDTGFGSRLLSELEGEVEPEVITARGDDEEPEEE